MTTFDNCRGSQATSEDLNKLTSLFIHARMRSLAAVHKQDLVFPEKLSKDYKRILEVLERHHILDLKRNIGLATHVRHLGKKETLGFSETPRDYLTGS